MNSRTVAMYALATVLVIILGALAGWYFFLRSQTAATVTLGAGRGFGTATPFGSGPGTPAFSGTAAGGSTTSTSSGTQPPQLWHVTESPVAGIGFATSTDGVRVRYAERATGYVFEADPQKGATKRLTNTLMPKVYEAYFASGDRVIERSLDSTGALTTFAGFLGATSSSLTGTSLPKNIQALSPGPKSSQVLYLIQKNGGVAAVQSAWDGSSPKELFSSALDWRVSWLSDGRVLLAQKAADSVEGYAYTLKNGALDPLLGPLPGLTLLARSNSSALLYSTSSGGLALFVQSSASSSPVVRLAIATIADKCLWAPGDGEVAYCAVPQTPPSGNFLDAWYRGEVHSSDALWRIDARSGQAELIFAPSPDVVLDVIDPIMDESGAYIAFRNAVDESPWILRLNK
jgi:hypothetical protein